MIPFDFCLSRFSFFFLPDFASSSSFSYSSIACICHQFLAPERNEGKKNHRTQIFHEAPIHFLVPISTSVKSVLPKKTCTNLFIHLFWLIQIFGCCCCLCNTRMSWKTRWKTIIKPWFRLHELAVFMHVNSECDNKTPRHICLFNICQSTQASRNKREHILYNILFTNNRLIMNWLLLVVA